MPKVSGVKAVQVEGLPDDWGDEAKVESKAPEPIPIEDTAQAGSAESVRAEAGVVEPVSTLTSSTESTPPIVSPVVSAPSPEAGDPWSVAADAQSRAVALEQQLKAIQEQYDKLTTDARSEAEKREEQGDIDREVQVRRAMLEARKNGDADAELSLQFDLEDVRRRISKRETERYLNRLKQVQANTPNQVAPINRQEAAAIQAETFKKAYRVSDAEEARMIEAGKRLLTERPEWQSVRPWDLWSETLRQVRNGKTTAPVQAVEGNGHSAAASKPTTQSKWSDDQLTTAARMFGKSVADYKKLIEGGR